MTHSMLKRWPPLALFALLAGCGKSPTDTAIVPPADTSCATRSHTVAATLVDCIQQGALWNQMVAFQQIADANPGPDGHASRNSGEPGYLASVNYVANLMRAAGYRVTIQSYTFPYYVYSSLPVLSEVSPTASTFVRGVDWTLSRGSGSGDVTAAVQPVGGIIIPGTATSTSGCTGSDFAGFVPGRIALIQRGTCSYDTKVALAQTAGASGVILFNDGSSGHTGIGGCSLTGTATTPVVCLASYAVGLTLFNQAAQGPVTARLNIGIQSDPNRLDYNLIADSPYGDTNHVVVVDAHLDAIYGAGMLDNASGSATILEIALKMAKTHTRNQLRYIWFGGEELGLLGSFYYTRNIAASELSKIVFDIDADVTATPNYVIAIADPANSGGVGNFPATVVPASQLGNNYFASYFTTAGLPYQRRSNDGTDSYAFALVGVPNTGILTGQDCCKSQADVNLFGGFTGNYEGNLKSTDGGFVDRPFLWGDNLGNNDPGILTTVSKAFASVVFNLANDASLSAAGVRATPALPGRAATPTSKALSGMDR